MLTKWPVSPPNILLYQHTIIEPFLEGGISKWACVGYGNGRLFIVNVKTIQLYEMDGLQSLSLFDCDVVVLGYDGLVVLL